MVAFKLWKLKEKVQFLLTAQNMKYKFLFSLIFSLIIVFSGTSVFADVQVTPTIFDNSTKVCIPADQMPLGYTHTSIRYTKDVIELYPAGKFTQDLNNNKDNTCENNVIWSIENQFTYRGEGYYVINNWHDSIGGSSENYWYVIEVDNGIISSLSVNGSCGSASGGSFSQIPTANLCSSGTLDFGVVNDGETFVWSCAGSGGGTNEFCYANVTIGSYAPMLSQIIFPLSNLTGITLGSTTEISSSSLSLTGDVYYAGFDETLNVDQIQFILQNINDYSEIKSNTFSFEEYLTSNENTESFSVSFTGIPENEKYLVYYNVHTTTGRTLKMLPPDATYVRYGIFTPVGIPVDFDSNNYTAPECSIDNMGACFKSIILWAFTPSENTIQKWKNTSETISSKVPFGYFYLIANKFKSIQLDTLSPSTNLAIDFVINNQTMRFLDIRQLIEEIGQENYDFYMNLCRAVIWFMFLEYLFNRLTGLGSGESVIQGFKPN